MTNLKTLAAKAKQAVQNTANQSTTPKPTKPTVTTTPRSQPHTKPNLSMGGKVETQMVTANVPKPLLDEFDKYLKQVTPKLTRTKWLILKMQLDLAEYRSHRA